MPITSSPAPSIRPPVVTHHAGRSFTADVRCCLLVVGRSLCVGGLLAAWSSFVARLLLPVVGYFGYNLVVDGKNMMTMTKTTDAGHEADSTCYYASRKFDRENY